jgi:hypothetical protein
VDLCPETDPEDVPHLRQAGHVPEYALEVLSRGVWVLDTSGIPPAELPDAVESMHWAYTEPVRLVEDGLPVFTCWPV